MIHPTAIIDATAEIGDVEIGPYVIIGPGVRLHDGVQLGAHCVIECDTEVGSHTVLHSHVVLGGAPQDRKHDPSVRTQLVIGAHNVFREFSTAHRGTSTGRRETRIGDGNYFMANSHVAHDCIVGSNTMFANSAAIAGHVEVGDGAVLGGLCAVHQHSRIGRLTMIGGGAMCAQDVPPFTIAQGDRARLFGVNITGLRRHGMGDETISTIKAVWRTLFSGELPLRAAISRVEEAYPHSPEANEIVAFIRASSRGVCRILPDRTTG